MKKLSSYFSILQKRFSHFKKHLCIFICKNVLLHDKFLQINFPFVRSAVKSECLFWLGIRKLKWVWNWFFTYINYNSNDNKTTSAFKKINGMLWDIVDKREYFNLLTTHGTCKPYVYVSTQKYILSYLGHTVCIQYVV